MAQTVETRTLSTDRVRITIDVRVVMDGSAEHPYRGQATTGRGRLTPWVKGARRDEVRRLALGTMLRQLADSIESSEEPGHSSTIYGIGVNE